MSAEQAANKAAEQAAQKIQTPAIRIDGLRKQFGSVEALRGVSFSQVCGQRLALLGPNGAGKTTTIRCLSGRTRPSSGTIELFGHPIDSMGVRDQLGIVPQEIALYGDLTTIENLRAFGRFHGLNRKTIKDRVQWALHWTGLEDRAGSLVNGFSGGMKRRVNLACGVLHQPSVLLLDEPTVGVDPQSRQKIFTMLDQLHRAGTSILLTTHHLDEAQQYSDQIVIIDQGTVVAEGTIDELIDQSVGRSRMVRLRIDRPLDRLLPSPLSKLGRVGSDQLSTRIDDVSKRLPQLLTAVHEQGYRVCDVDVSAPSLHDVFLHLTGHELRD
ncbi:ABC transporter ATP-binding protein [Rubripirellula obstinata]|nr:ABC transporter ATP-binding protein [Rubripirellula obstinata]